MTEASDPETAFSSSSASARAPCAALHGMSRKVLAKVSGISERYIAQLESGKGNVSIVLLRRLSHAMGAPLEDLIPSTEPVPDWPVMRALVRKATPAADRAGQGCAAGGSYCGASQDRRSPASR